jgi:hypothetical protein
MSHARKSVLGYFGQNWIIPFVYSVDMWLVIPDFWLNFGVLSWKRSDKARVILEFGKPLRSYIFNIFEKIDLFERELKK